SRRRHTRWPRDWSSDVCSSDLGVAVAINRSHGSTNGATLAATMEKFKKVPTLSGLVSFSAKFHTVFGRQYRVIKIQDNKAHLVRSEERRVGKECRSRGWQNYGK